MAEASSSKSFPAASSPEPEHVPSPTDEGAISLHLPTSFLVLPPVAGLIGLGIGMSRGGSRARLRFLAENAHRPPTTYRGWYFYTKTRNYRIVFGALRTGGKYALALSSATLAYVALDESVGVVRERLIGKHGEGQWQAQESEDGRPRRVGWREGGVWWGDGMIAGGILGLGVGAIYRLPRPLFMRSIGIGTIMGGTTSALQTVQAKIGEMRTANEASTHKAVGEMADTGIALPVEEEIVPVTMGEAADVELPQVVSEGKGSSWSSLWSWIPGTSR